MDRIACATPALRCLVQLVFAAFALCCTRSFAQTSSLPNGVASGDVDQTSAMLWARSTSLGELRFEYGRDESFAEFDGVMSVDVVDPEAPVKVEISGLTPGAHYVYRVTDADGGQLVGRFTTAAERGLHGLRFGGSGCGRGDLTPFMSVTNVPERELDFFVHMGDSIYADWPWDVLSPDELPASQSRTLSEFRSRHIEVHSERLGLNPMADLRRSTSLYVMMDDHEVTNDYAGGELALTDLRFADDPAVLINETELYRNGLTALHEFYPIREDRYEETGDARTDGKPRLYRYRTFGSDAALITLDARSFRDEELELEAQLSSRRDYLDYVTRSFDPTRTMLGEAQLALLQADLLDAKSRGVTWTFIVVPEPMQLLGPALASDRFEGYAFERTRILQFIDENRIENVVFVSSDIHAMLINQITYQEAPGSPQIATSAFEVVAGPLAFAAPFGPSVMEYAPPLLRELYDRFGPVGQNNLYAAVGNVVLDFYHLPRFGLRNAPVNARLLEGAYLSVNTYSWSEFEIDAATQCLTVTSWGVPWYKPEDVQSRPDYVLGLTPRVVGKFQVQPTITEGMVAFDEGVQPCLPSGALCGAINLPMLAMLPAFWLLSLRGRAGRMLRRT